MTAEHASERGTLRRAGESVHAFATRLYENMRSPVRPGLAFVASSTVARSKPPGGGHSVVLPSQHLAVSASPPMPPTTKREVSLDAYAKRVYGAGMGDSGVYVS
jgi:hypothetical protein